MANFFKDNDDLKYYMDKWIDWDSIVKHTEVGNDADFFSSTNEALEFYTDILNMVGEFVAEEIAPHAAEIDREGTLFKDGEVTFPKRLDSIFKKIKELDLHGMTLPRDLGGMNVPMLVYFINAELFSRADVSVCAHHSFHGGIAMAMLFFSASEGSVEIDLVNRKIVSTRFDEEIKEIARGEAWGSMDITEPDAGSDMAALRTTGVQDENGNWFVTGQKIFITSGHGKYHFVIARTEKCDDEDNPLAGLAGLSFFLVKTYEDDKDGKRTWFATVDRVEEKLGHHGSVTAAISFDNTPAKLVGKRGEGFKYMLKLMNNARVGVGFESLGLCEAAFRMAKAYCEERPSMGKTIDKHEMIADYFDEMEANLQGIRAMAMYSGFHEELAEKKRVYAEAMIQNDIEKAQQLKEAKRHQAKSRRVTPLLKYFASEKSVEMTRMCVQLHGGNGYMTEFGAEKLLRDAMVMPIYEGTSQIQALMAMKDTLMGILKNPQRFVRRRAQAQWRSLSARDPLEKGVARLQSASLGIQQYLLTKTVTQKVRTLQGQPLTSWPEQFTKNWNPKRDFAFAMLHSERLIKILIDEAIAEILLEQVHRHPERRSVLERHLERAEARVKFNADLITTTGSRILEKLGHSSDEEQIAAEA